jgi:hypothetical protein
VDDSKAVFRGPSGLAFLEKTALSFFCALHGKPPATLGEWMNRCVPRPSAVIDDCPWYGLDPFELHLPRVVSPEAVARSAARLVADMRGHGVRPFRFRQAVITVPLLNRVIAQQGNKAAALYEAVASLVSEILPKESPVSFRIDVDKLGGRAYYGDMVNGIFPFCGFTAENEGRSLSAYRVQSTGGEGWIRFIRSGDALHQHVALASILSKYTRELFMHLFNRFWTRRLPGLRPTAGYPLDAARFIEQIAPAARAEGLDPSSFIRAR